MSEEREDQKGRVPCPQCAEPILQAAKKCRFCGFEFANHPNQVQARGKASNRKFLTIGCLLLLGLISACCMWSAFGDTFMESYNQAKEIGEHDRKQREAVEKAEKFRVEDAREEIKALLQLQGQTAVCADPAKAKAVVSRVNRVSVFGELSKELEGISDLKARCESVVRQAKAEADEKQQAELVARIKEAEKARRQIRTSEDEIEGVTWHHHKSTTKFTNVRSIHPYYGERPGGQRFLRMRIQYTGEDWLFIERYMIVADGKKWTLSPGRDLERDHDTRVWEWWDKAPTDEDIRMLEAIAASKKATVRFVGKQYHRDWTVPENQKKAISDVLTAFRGPTKL